MSEEEKSVLRLHPNFAVRETITTEKLDFENELGNAKLRYELRKENAENLVEDEENFSGTNATTRTFFGPVKGLDMNINNGVSVEELGEEMEASVTCSANPLIGLAKP